MQFTDFTFLFIFLPAFSIVFFILPKQLKVIWIFIGSSIFYFWAEPLYFWMLLLLVFINYSFAVLIKKTSSNQILSKIILALIILIDLGLMVFLRDSSLVSRVLNLQISSPSITESLFFPLGISFITFSFLSYLLDVSKDPTIGQGSLFQFANFILFFPKIQQGPIQDFSGFQKSIAELDISTSKIYIGITRFIRGLSKKVLIADNLAPVADSVFSANLSQVGLGLSWYGLIAFALQIYFDFSGYTDMAIGLGSALGFNLPENFNAPYSCVSVADFWRRWHMTLTAWFRKYIFFPLEFRFRQLGSIRQPLNLLIVFLLTGAWHGISPNFLVWGGYFGFLLAIESMGLGRWLKRAPLFIQHFYALLMVLFGWVFFRLRKPDSWGLFFGSLFGMNGMTGNVTARTLNILGYLPIVVIAVILCIPLPSINNIFENKIIKVFTTALQIVLFILSIAFLVEGGYQAFLYRRF